MIALNKHEWVETKGEKLLPALTLTAPSCPEGQSLVCRSAVLLGQTSLLEDQKLKVPFATQ